MHVSRKFREKRFYMKCLKVFVDCLSSNIFNPEDIRASDFGTSESSNKLVVCKGLDVIFTSATLWNAVIELEVVHDDHVSFGAVVECALHC
mmetsp:Transcript_46858/g.54763  ORF Transcript_46858/g.54763 Transcript_46858/m.54763 type:complete len:91 (-) Transcript_46858:78-350(-)